MKKILLALIVPLSTFTYVHAQSDLCTGAVSLTPGASCVSTAYSVSNTFTVDVTNPGCYNNNAGRDGWFSFTATSTLSSITATPTNRDVGIAVYSGSCGSLTLLGCSDAGTGTTVENVTISTTVGVTYYILISRVNGTNTASGNICVTNPAITTCSATFYDSGGSGGNYSNNELTRTIYCPSTPGQAIQVSFVSFNLEPEYDFLYVYDGPSTSSTLLGTYHSTTNPGTIVATSSNSTGCLTFLFDSDGSTTRAGWEATISCTTPFTPPSLGSSSNNCTSAPTVCGNTSISGNSSGAGTQELPNNNTIDGCLTIEHQSSWYFFRAATSGTLEFVISPTNGTDDYDFALWGPASSAVCPPTTTPARCSYAAGGGNTGAYTGAGDNSESSLGDKWIEGVTATAGDVFVLLIDNFSSSTSPFTLSWMLAGGATLDCSTPLPIELISFNGFSNGEKNIVEWTTMTEENNHHFNIEKSSDGITFSHLQSVPGAGNSLTPRNYSVTDPNPFSPFTYYRLSQVDFDGTRTDFPAIAVENNPVSIEIGEIVPNPNEGWFTISIKSPIENSFRLVVTDVTGKPIHQMQLNDLIGNVKPEINVSELNAGIYFIQVYSQSGKYLGTRKLVKK
ncbi:MAG: T9SS type A sorting domain-containing protein [Flavobacteriales bacterium]|nr:T9SS type A sorting domain-containing protein [Flavobacteriales bacterium]